MTHICIYEDRYSSTLNEVQVTPSVSLRLACVPYRRNVKTETKRQQPTHQVRQHSLGNKYKQ